jgi:hypothetical protein
LLVPLAAGAYHATTPRLFLFEFNAADIAAEAHVVEEPESTTPSFPEILEAAPPPDVVTTPTSCVGLSQPLIPLIVAELPPVQSADTPSIDRIVIMQ